MTRTLEPAVAGTWYPADPHRLASTIDALFAGAQPAGTASAPWAVVAPHAGLVYSGRVAASAFRPWIGRASRRVVAVGPSHHFAFRGIVVPRASEVRTPLGLVPIDVAAVDRIATHAGVTREDRPFGPEHCLEIELPFLQRALQEGWSLVPVLTGTDVRGETATRLAAILRDAVGDRTLWVASSDFTHYGAGFGYVPFRDRVRERIETLDRSVLDRVEERDPVGLERRLDETGATVCGRHAIGLLLRGAPADARGRTVAYDTSGAQTGDWSHTVSYAAVRFGDDE